MQNDIKDLRNNSTNASDLIYNRQQFIQLMNQQIQNFEAILDSQSLNEQYRFLCGFLRESSSVVLFLQQQLYTLYKLRLYQLSAVSLERNQLTPPRYNYLNSSENQFKDSGFYRNEQLRNQSSVQRALERQALQSDSLYNIYQKQRMDDNNQIIFMDTNITPQQYQQKYLIQNSAFLNDKNEDILGINLNESYKNFKNYSDFFDNQNNKQSTNFSDYFDTKNRYRVLKQQNLELDFQKAKQTNITDESKENHVSHFGNLSQSKQIKIVKKSTNSNNNLAIYSSPQQEIAQEEKIQSKNFSFEDVDIYEDKNSNSKYLRHDIPVQEFQLLNLPDFSPKQNNNTPFKMDKEKQNNQKPINSSHIQKFECNNNQLNYDFDINENNILQDCQNLNTEQRNSQNNQIFEIPQQNNVQITSLKNTSHLQIPQQRNKLNNSQPSNIENIQSRNILSNLIIQSNSKQANKLSQNFSQQPVLENSSTINTQNKQQTNNQNQSQVFSNLTNSLAQTQNNSQIYGSNISSDSNKKQISLVYSEKLNQKPQRKKKERAKRILKAYYQQNSDESVSSNPINKKKKITKNYDSNKRAYQKKSNKAKSLETSKLSGVYMKRGDLNQDDSNAEEASIFENETSEESESESYYEQGSDSEESDSLKEEIDKSFNEDQSESNSDIEISEKDIQDNGQVHNNSSKLNMNSKTKRGHYKKYSVKLKKKLVNLLLEGEQPKELSQKYNIPMKNLQRWKIYGAERREGGGRKIMDLNMEVILLEYCIDYTLRGRCRCPRKLIMQKARDFTKEANKFKGSKGWLDKYSTRTGLSKIMSEYKQLRISNEREIFKYVKCKSIEHIKQKIKQVNPLNIFTSQQYIKFLEGQFSVYKNFWEIELLKYKDISGQYWYYYENRNLDSSIYNNYFIDLISEYKKFNDLTKLKELNYYFGIPPEYIMKFLPLQNNSDKNKSENYFTASQQRSNEQSQINQQINNDQSNQDEQKQSNQVGGSLLILQNSVCQNDENQDFQYGSENLNSRIIPNKQSKQDQYLDLTEPQIQFFKNKEIINKKDNQINSKSKLEAIKFISDDDSSIEEIFRNYENNID